MWSAIKEKYDAWKMRNSPIEIRYFVKKYGAYCGHYNFSSTNEKTQIEFLIDYYKYLNASCELNNFKIKENDKQFKSPTLYFDTARENHTTYYALYFHRDGTPIFVCKDTDGSSGSGQIGMTWEINLPNKNK